MPRAFWTVVSLLILSTAVRAQPSIEVPTVGVPPDFSGIVGKYQQPKMSATPTDVHVEQPIRVEIRITGAGPVEQEPDRKKIRRILPRSWDNDFFVNEKHDEHRVVRDEKTWLFVYVLKPKHTAVKAIDDFTLVTFDPEKPSRNKFNTKYANRIEITVKPKLDSEQKITIVDPAAPASFYEVLSVDVHDSVVPISIAAWQVALFLVLPPILCVAVVFGYRRAFPSASARSQRFRSEAARRALVQLERRSGPAWTVVACYLHERFGFAAADATPAEVAAFLQRRGFARPLIKQARAFFQDCDAVRFTPEVGAEMKRLPEDAACLIQSLEADPCARG
jgi:hypothetical protein